MIAQPNSGISEKKNNAGEGFLHPGNSNVFFFFLMCEAQVGQLLIINEVMVYSSLVHISTVCSETWLTGAGARRRICFPKAMMKKQLNRWRWTALTFAQKWWQTMICWPDVFCNAWLWFRVHVNTVSDAPHTVNSTQVKVTRWDRNQFSTRNRSSATFFKQLLVHYERQGEGEEDWGCQTAAL